jgi:hypothetical protein
MTPEMPTPSRTKVAPRIDATPAARVYEAGIAAQYRECARESAH